MDKLQKAELLKAELSLISSGHPQNPDLAESKFRRLLDALEADNVFWASVCDDAVERLESVRVSLNQRVAAVVAEKESFVQSAQSVRGI